MGHYAGRGVSGGQGCNVIIGSASGQSQLCYSTIVGTRAGGENSSNTCCNTFLGYQAGYYNSGKSNTAIGVNAGRRTTGDCSIAIGFEAGECVKGAHNISMGYCSLAGWYLVLKLHWY